MTLILTTHRAVVFYAYYIEDRVDASLQETVAKTTTTWLCVRRFDENAMAEATC